MRSEKEKYEQLINDSPLFLLDRDEEYSAYKRESYKMVEYLYCYLLAVNRDKFEPYGCEITELAIRCIDGFDSSKGFFLHYFNAAWKREFSHLFGEEISDSKYRGLKISETDKRAIKKYIKLIETSGSNIPREELYEKLSVSMGISIDRVIEIAVMNETIVSSGEYVNESGKTQSVWDMLRDELSFEEEIENSERLQELLNILEREYCELQERQKPIVSDLLTIKIIQIVDTNMSEYSFINEAIVKEYYVNGELPSQRDIAEKYNRNEASISRTLREFTRKLQGEMNNGIK